MVGFLRRIPQVIDGHIERFQRYQLNKLDAEIRAAYDRLNEEDLDEEKRNAIEESVSQLEKRKRQLEATLGTSQFCH